MKLFPKFLKSGLLVAALAAGFHAVDCSGEIGFDVYANVLYTTTTNTPLPTTGLVMLVCSTLDTNFSAPTTNGFVSGDDVVLKKWDLSLNNNPGEFSGSTGPWTLSVSNVTSGDPVALYWFPTLNLSSTSITNGTPYGVFTDPIGLDGDPFVVPADGTSYFLSFNTPAANGGNFLESQGVASLVVGNHAPVANPDTFSRTSSIAVKMKISDLLANDTDADNDPLTLISLVGVLTTNSVTLSNDTQYVYYPSNAPNVRDQFTYTITDGKGTFASTTVAIQIVTATGTNTVVSLQVGVPGAGTNSIQFVGIPNYTYVTQYATNVSGPWFPLSTNTADPNGIWTAVDVNATNISRFYRAAY